MYSELTQAQTEYYKEKIKPHLGKMAELRGKGAGIIQIAESIGVSHTTLYNYTKKVKELNDALDEGKELLIINLENALWSKALGGAVVKKTTTTTYKSSGEEIVRVEEEIAQPDNTAMIFALKSLRPEIYVEQKPNNDEYDEIDEPFSDKLKREYENGDE